MNDLVVLVDGVPMVSSVKVAKKFGKVHRDVLRAVNNLDCSREFSLRNFAQSTYEVRGKDYQCFNMTRDGFSFLCMGFTGKDAAEWKEKYIEAFNMMESALSDSGSLMSQINKSIKLLETDKEIASSCAKGLSNWKQLKKEHTEEVDRLISAAQLSLGFER